MTKWIPGIDVDLDDLPRWDAERKTLTGSGIAKVRKLLKLKLVECINRYHFRVHPIEGYNSTVYDIAKAGDWVCSCQGFAQNGGCNHVRAVLLWIKQNTEEGLC